MARSMRCSAAVALRLMHAVAWDAGEGRGGCRGLQEQRRGAPVGGAGRRGAPGGLVQGKLVVVLSGPELRCKRQPLACMHECRD